MLEHRFYTQRRDFSIEASTVFDHTSDDGALHHAKHIITDKDIEAWQGARKVFRLAHDGAH